MTPLDDGPAAGGRRAAVREREEAVVASLRSLGTALDGEPDAAFRTATRSRLVAMAAVRTTAPAPVPRSPLMRVLAGRPGPARSPLRRRLTAGLTGAALAVTALATLVAVAVGSTPGDPLYGLKRGTEQSQLALSGSDRGITLLGFAHTRLTELAALTGAGDNDLAVSTLRSMDEQATAGAAAVTAHAVAAHDPTAVRRLAAWEADQSARLAALRPHLPAAAQPAADQSEALLVRVGDRGTALARALQCASGPAVGGRDPLGPVPVPCPAETSTAPAQGSGGAAGSVPGSAVPAVPGPGTVGTGGSTTGTNSSTGPGPVGTVTGGSGSGASGSGASGSGGVLLPTPALPTPALPTPALSTPALPTPALSTPALPTPALPAPALPTPALPGTGSGGGLLPPVTGALPSSTPSTPSIGVTVPPLLPGSTTSAGPTSGTGSLPGVPSVSVCVEPLAVGNC